MIKTVVLGKVAIHSSICDPYRVESGQTDMEKVKKFTLADFLGLIISAKRCVILDMSKAMEKCKIRSIFSKLHETAFIDH